MNLSVFKNSAFIISVLLSLVLISCNDQGDKETEHIGQESSKKEVQEIKMDSFSLRFKNLIKTQEGTFRGVSLGDDLKKVKEKEGKVAAEDSASDHIAYMMDFAELEETEVRYNLDKASHVKGIDVNIYPKSKNSQDSLFTEFDAYFTEKYGKASVKEPNLMKWELKDYNLFIVLEKRDTEKVHDINLRFAYLLQEMASYLDEDKE